MVSMSAAEGGIVIWSGEQEIRAESQEGAEVERKGLRSRSEEIGRVC